MDAPVIGLFVGLLLGIALVVSSFPEMLLVALFGAIGYLVVKVIRGEIDVERYFRGTGRGQP